MPNKLEDVKEIVNALDKNRERIALEIPESIDYYSFLHGFDHVLDAIKWVLNK